MKLLRQQSKLCSAAGATNRDIHRLLPEQIKGSGVLAYADPQGGALQDKIVRAGIGRTVQMGDWSGIWFDVPRGRVWLGEIVSPGAVGLRVQFNQLVAAQKRGAGGDPSGRRRLGRKGGMGRSRSPASAAKRSPR